MKRRCSRLLRSQITIIAASGPRMISEMSPSGTSSQSPFVRVDCGSGGCAGAATRCDFAFFAAAAAAFFSAVFCAADSAGGPWNFSGSQ